MMPLPPVTNRTSGPGPAVSLLLDPALRAFQGHFPGDPLLPGVVQVDWALRLGTEAFGPLGVFRGLERVKFLAPMRPGETVELRLARPAPDRVTYVYAAGDAKKASGTLLFRAGP